MTILCSFSTVARFVFWVIVIGIVIGLSLDQRGANTSTDAPPISIVTTANDPGAQLASTEGK